MVVVFAQLIIPAGVVMLETSVSSFSILNLENSVEVCFLVHSK